MTAASLSNFSQTIPACSAASKINARSVSSDFDIRHNLNVNGLFEMPFGKGKKFLNTAPGWVNQAIGGWQLSGIMRARSGLPSAISGSGIWNTNYWLGSLSDLKAGATLPEIGTGFNEKGNPTSLTFVGRVFGEASLLALAKRYQDATQWHLKHPAL